MLMDEADWIAEGPFWGDRPNRSGRYV